LAAEEDWKHAKICAFGSTRRKNFSPEDDPNLQAILEANTPLVSIFGKSWTLHAEVALGVTLEENLELIESSVRYLHEKGKRVIYDAEHFFDGYKDNADYALKTLEAAANAGASVLVLCDTNGGTMPSEVKKMVEVVVDRFDIPVGIHTHNDSGCAVANSIMAIEGGATHVQGTINGIGERCGNADLCVVIPDLQLKMNHSCVPEDQLSQLRDLSHFVDEIANLDPVGRTGFVGRSAFAHKGGIHVSAVMKEPKAYEHIDPELVGNTRRVLVSDLSGQSNVRYKAEEMQIDLSENDAAKKAVKRIKELEHLGYEFEGAEASFELLLRTIQGEPTNYFLLKRARVRSEKNEAEFEHAEATLMVEVGDEEKMVVSEGNGPVNAMAEALVKSLIDFYPTLSELILKDYKVRVLTPENGTAASVRVLTTLQGSGFRWTTVGVSTNILEASWKAIADGIRYYLLKCGVAPTSASSSKEIKQEAVA